MKLKRRHRKEDYAPIPVLQGADGKPVIRGPYGDTDEKARLQSALNIRADKATFERVVAGLKQRYGSRKKAIEWMKRAYPEAFQKDAPAAPAEVTNEGQTGKQDIAGGPDLAARQATE